jgi:hypothetical protein
MSTTLQSGLNLFGNPTPKKYPVAFFAPTSPMSAVVCRCLAFNNFAVNDRCPWGAAVSLCVYNDFWEPFWHRFSLFF